MRRAIAILLLGAACPGLAGELVPTAAPTKVKACLVPGYQELYVAGAGLYVGGEQDAAQLEKMKSLGVKHVIDLRDAPATATSLAPDAEAEVAKGLGLTYARVPVKNGDDLTRENVERLQAALLDTNGQPVLVHCATGNCVAALLALRAVWLEHKDPEQALGFSRRSGLDALEPVVLARLGAKPGP